MMGFTDDKNDGACLPCNLPAKKHVLTLDDHLWFRQRLIEYCESNAKGVSIDGSNILSFCKKLQCYVNDVLENKEGE